MFTPFHDRNPIRHIRQPWVNYGLIAVTVLCFLLQSLIGSRANSDAIVALGMVPGLHNGTAVYDQIPGLPDQLTFITYAFLHADIFHLFSNMLFLFIFGDNVEDALGHLRYFIFYLVTAILAAMAHSVVNASSLGPLIGASGAVAGVMGAYIILYPHARVFVLFRLMIPIPIPVPAFWMLGFWILTQLFYAVFAAGEPVAWWAHLGGFLAGMLLGATVKRREVPLFGGR